LLTKHELYGYLLDTFVDGTMDKLKIIDPITGKGLWGTDYTFLHINLTDVIPFSITILYLFCLSKKSVSFFHIVSLSN